MNLPTIVKEEIQNWLRAQKDDAEVIDIYDAET